MTSTDIGVAENGTEAIDLSQLKGTGTKYSDFTWQTMTASTYGVNKGQSFDCKIPLIALLMLSQAILRPLQPTLSWDAVEQYHTKLQWYYFGSSND
jgi:hypothetical protein